MLYRLNDTLYLELDRETMIHVATAVRSHMQLRMPDKLLAELGELLRYTRMHDPTYTRDGSQHGPDLMKAAITNFLRRLFLPEWRVCPTCLTRSLGRNGKCVNTL